MADSTPTYGVLPIAPPTEGVCPVCRLRPADAAHSRCCSEPCERALHAGGAELLAQARRAFAALRDPERGHALRRAEEQLARGIAAVTQRPATP